jgi:hypothetical protein
MQTLPCVLHVENRNGIKLLTMAFIEGLSNAKNGDIFNNIAAVGTRVSLYVAEVERLINRSILGTDDDPCQWTCPYNAQKRNWVQLQWTTPAHVVLLMPLMLS